MISPAARIPIIWSLRDVKGRVTLSPTSVVFPSSVNNELLLWHSCKCEFHFEIGSQYLLHCYIDVKRKLSRLYDPFWGPSVPFGLVLTFIGKKCVSSLLWLRGLYVEKIVSLLENYTKDIFLTSSELDSHSITFKPSMHFPVPSHSLPI